ncbi:MAG: Hsp20/alpha crystallin family protein [Treponema sp.]|jgi:HSP20 family protein|nr:Hsp20/alpha crystallin family protein [Treponema sp.]
MKAVTLYRPLTIENALDDFDRYLESFFGDSPLTPAERVFRHQPAVDVRETKDAYILEAELPGYDEKDIEVHMDGGNLTIESKKEDAAERNVTPKGADKHNDGAYILRERRSASFSRSFKLPENADPEKISGVFKNGILSLEIKKRAEAQKRVIQIERK